MTDTITTVQTVVPRDRFQRPLIIPAGGGKPVPYNRASSFDVLEDRFNLERWGRRMVALGCAERADLILAIAAHRDDKKKLNDLCEQAIEAAKASAAATTGTALHKLTELVDRGDPLPTLSPAAVVDLEAYRKAMTPLMVIASEQFVVCDEVKAAGTFDRIVELDGQRFIADVKTGSIEWGMAGIAQQLAIYSRGQIYDVKTGDRTPLDVHQRAALIIHLPQGEGRCDLVWVDINRGWDLALLSRRVRDERNPKGLTAPFVPATTAVA